MEPTLYAIGAGFEAPFSWLKQQEPDWTWLMLPAVLGEGELSRAALAWILAFRSEPVTDMEGFDATLPGWSWAPGTAAWVEPTSWAMLSLARMGAERSRQEAGRRLLLDRQGKDGGWNYGNPRVLGQDLRSVPGPTSWAIRALVAVGGAAEVVQAALRFQEVVLKQRGSSSLALVALAADAAGEDPRRYVEALLPRLGDEGAAERLDWTALAVQALDAALRWESHG